MVKAVDDEPNLKVIAIDGGSGEDQLTTRVPVNISIADVNNKLPRLLLCSILFPVSKMILKSFKFRFSMHFFEGHNFHISLAEE